MQPDHKAPQGPQGTAPTTQPCSNVDLKGNWYFTDVDVMTGTYETCLISLNSNGQATGGSCALMDINNISSTVNFIGGGINVTNPSVCSVSGTNINLNNGNVLFMSGYMSADKTELHMGYANMSTGSRATFTAVKK